MQMKQALEQLIKLCKENSHQQNDHQILDFFETGEK